MVVIRNGCGLLILGTLKSPVYYKEKLINWADFLYGNTNLGNLKVTLIIISSRDLGTLKSGVSHKWFDELSRSTEWYLYTESDGYPLKLPTFAILGWHCLA